MNSLTPEKLVADGVVPAHLETALVSRETYATGNAYLALTAQGARLWDRGWQELPGGLVTAARIWGLLPRSPGCCGSRSSSSSPSTRSSRSGWATSRRSTSRCRTGTRSTGTSATCWQAIEDLAARRPDVARRSCARVLYVVRRVALSLAIGYPVAWYAARHAGRWSGLAAARARAAVLDLLPDADVRLDEPARQPTATRRKALDALSIDALFRALGLMERRRTGSAASTSP